MILFISGEDTFLSRKRLKELVDQFIVQRDPEKLNVIRLNASEKTLTPATLHAELFTIPFLAEKRMIILEGLFSTKGESLWSILQKFTEEKSLPDTTVCIVFDDLGAPRKKIGKLLHQSLSKLQYAQDFSVLSGAAFSSFVANLAKDQKVTLDPAVLRALQASGMNSANLTNLIAQAASYVGFGGIVSIQELSLFMPTKIDDNAFALTDALSSGNGANAIQHLEIQLNSGAHPVQIIGILIRQVRILRALLEAGGDNFQEQQIAKELGLHPYVLKKTKVLIPRFKLNQLSNWYKYLAEADLSIKLGRESPRLEVEHLLSKMVLKNTP